MLDEYDISNTISSDLFNQVSEAIEPMPAKVVKNLEIDKDDVAAPQPSPTPYRTLKALQETNIMPARR